MGGMRRLLPALVGLALLSGCTPEQEPVANKYERQAAEIEEKARALEAQVENEVRATEARLQNEVDLLRNQTSALEENAGTDANSSR